MVGDLVAEVDELGFEGRALVEKIFGQLRMLLSIVIAGVLNDTFAHLECEVQAAEGGIALLEVLDDAQCMKIVVEGQSMLMHRRIESLLSGMAKWRMADVMNQCERLGQIGVEPQRSGDGARDLRNFQRVRQPVAEVVG